MDIRGYLEEITVTERRNRPVPELTSRDLIGVPTVVLGAVLALFEQLEVYRPLTFEEQSAWEVVDEVRAARNQLEEERFGRPTSRAEHPVYRRARLSLGE